jgi:hypothetical protein
MDVIAVILVLGAAGGAGWTLAGPLRGGKLEADDAAYMSQLEDLEASKESRYREIREAEMDYRTGKLSEADWKAIDRQLRAEAVELLRRLDALGAAEQPAPPESAAAEGRSETPAPEPVVADVPERHAADAPERA